MAQIPRAPATERVRRLGKRLRGRPHVIALVVALVALALAALFMGMMRARGEVVAIERREPAVSGSGGPPREGGGDRSAEEGDTLKDTGAESELVVDVSGAVANPAVVRLAGGARVGDAIDAAGGLAPDADISALNRAAKVADGDKVYVPRQGETAAAEAPAGQAPAASGAASQATSAPAERVNINTATAAELESLPGVGPATARAIVDERAKSGSFTSIDDLMRVSGIGEKKLEKLRDKARV